MRKHMRLLRLLALHLLFGCPKDGAEGAVDDPGGEDMTVVVEADKSLILEQEEQLKAEAARLRQAAQLPPYEEQTGSATR